ncbi:hypothetical protein D9M72_423370 [compost metagenome]
MNQITVNTSTAEKRARSAKLPTISAQVMPANVAWNEAKSSSVRVFDMAYEPSAGVNMPEKKARDRPPKKALPSVNAREYP